VNLPNMVEARKVGDGGAELTGVRRRCRAAPVVGEVRHVSGSCSVVVGEVGHAFGSCSEVVGEAGHSSGSCSKVV
jgi:hypothetical protein